MKCALDRLSAGVDAGRLHCILPIQMPVDYASQIAQLTAQMADLQASHTALDAELSGSAAEDLDAILYGRVDLSNGTLCVLSGGACLLVVSALQL